MTLVTQIRETIRRRAAYNRTRAELQNLPLDIALDLDIYRGDADRIASRAVYGA